MMGFRNGAMLWLISATVFLSAPLLAQDAPLMVGQWRGDVAETVEGGTARYRVFVAIDVDRHGRLVGSVSYSLECRGIWTSAERRGRVWHFEETITAGRANCASHVEVEIAREGDGLRVRLHPVGYPRQLARALLRRSAPDPASNMLSDNSAAQAADAGAPEDVQLPLVAILVPGRRDGRVTLPRSAVMSDERGSFVYILDHDDVARRREIVTGRVGDRGVAIVRGLVGDERVVLAAGPFLNPGERVRPERAPD
jgi:hypothetical protein